MKFRSGFYPENSEENLDLSLPSPWTEARRARSFSIVSPYSEAKDAAQAVLKKYWVDSDIVTLKTPSYESEFEKASRKKFYRLLRSWRNATEVESSLSNTVMNPAYQKILGMGHDAVPYILKELRRGSPLWWFWALEYITEANPVRSKYKGKVREMAKCWITYLENEYRETFQIPSGT
jgi:hypothetical protein